MKHKTSELSSALLDCAVAIIEGWPAADLVYIDSHKAFGSFGSQSICIVNPVSSEWYAGGPIIERERISIIRQTVDWCADMRGILPEFGTTPLVAAMRAFVASRLGDEVDLPESKE